MASIEAMESPNKRAQVKTERMQAYLKTQAQYSSPTKRLVCPAEGCNKVLTSSPGLRYHLKSHYQDRPYMCLRCRKRFKSANGLKYHTERTKCEYSGYTAGEDVSAFSSYITMESGGNHHVYRSPVRPPVLPSSNTVRCLTSDLECNEGPESLPDEDYGNAILRVQSSLPGFIRPRLCIKETNTTTQPRKIIKASPFKNASKPKEIFVKMVRPDSTIRVNSSLPSSPSSSTTSSLSSSPESGVTPKFHSGPMDALTELAIIATGPQSPLIRHNTAPKLEKDDHENHVTSSSPCPTSPKNSTWSHQWPTAVWQCFMKGTRIRFTNGSNTEWRLAEDVAYKESLSAKASNHPSHNNRYAPNGLRILRIEDCIHVLRLRFTTDVYGASELIVECQKDHPFFVKDKGWSSFYPTETAENYGIPCNDLEKNDVCLPPSNPDATFSLDVFQTLKSYDLSPQDSSAVLTLSSMAKQKRDQEMASPVKPFIPSTTINKPKRPMNAFMIFAQKRRMTYTQQHPGKDNRSISVLLGEAWKRMTAAERDVYHIEASVLASEQKLDHVKDQ